MSSPSTSRDSGPSPISNASLGAIEQSHQEEKAQSAFTARDSLNHDLASPDLANMDHLTRIFSAMSSGSENTSRRAGNRGGVNSVVEQQDRSIFPNNFTPSFDSWRTENPLMGTCKPVGPEQATTRASTAALSTTQQLWPDLRSSIWESRETQPKPHVHEGSATIEACVRCFKFEPLVVLHPCQHELCQRCVDNFMSHVQVHRGRCPICDTDVKGFNTCHVDVNKLDFTRLMKEEHDEQATVVHGAACDQEVSPSDKDDEQVQPSGNRSLSSTEDETTFDGVVTPPPGVGPNNTSDDISGQSPISFQDLAKKAKPKDWIVVKISNIPWDVSVAEVMEFLGRECRLVPFTNYGQPIHIIMDRTTGKTVSDAYAEFETLIDAQRAIVRRNQRLLKTRIVTLSLTTQQDLLKVIFPSWKGEFNGPNPFATDTMMMERGFKIPDAPFITRDEINALILMCRSNRLPFSRKSAERPYENLISIICKFPWHASDYYTALHRDHIFEALKLSIESLRLNLVRRVITVEPSLLERMVRVALLCPLFTDRQKMTVTQTARIPCPEDLAHLLVPQQPKVTTPHHREGDGRSVGSSLLSSPGYEGPTATFVAELHEQMASAQPRDEIYLDPEGDRGRPSSKPQKRFDPFIDEDQWPRLGSTIDGSQFSDSSKPSHASFPPPPQKAPPRLQNQVSHPTQLKLYRERLRQEQENYRRTGSTSRSSSRSTAAATSTRHVRTLPRYTSLRSPLSELNVQEWVDTYQQRTMRGPNDLLSTVHEESSMSTSQVQKLAEEHKVSPGLIASIIKRMQEGQENKEN